MEDARNIDFHFQFLYWMKIKWTKTTRTISKVVFLTIINVSVLACSCSSSISFCLILMMISEAYCKLKAFLFGYVFTYLSDIRHDLKPKFAF